jgi:hypothetical protein
MFTPVAHRVDVDEDVDIAPDADWTASALGDLPPETLRPLLEGARARGLAESYR